MTIDEVSALDAVSLLDAGAYLLDVRNDDEWEAGRAPNAHYLTLGELPTRFSEVPTNVTIVAVCRAGGRSLKAAEFLASNGYTAVNLTGGMQAWEGAGLPVVDQHGATGSVI